MKKWGEREKKKKSLGKQLETNEYDEAASKLFEERV